MAVAGALFGLSYTIAGVIITFTKENEVEFTSCQVAE
jgi:hypothetical protein